MNCCTSRCGYCGRCDDGLEPQGYLIVKYFCADCERPFVNSAVALEHADAYQHQMLRWPSKEPAFQAEQTAKRSA